MSKLQTRLLFAMVLMVFLYEVIFWHGTSAPREHDTTTTPTPAGQQTHPGSASSSSSSSQASHHSKTDADMQRMEKQLRQLMDENRRLVAKLASSSSSSSSSSSGSPDITPSTGTQDAEAKRAHEEQVEAWKQQVAQLESKVSQLSGSVAAHVGENAHPGAWWAQKGLNAHQKGCEDDFGYPLLDKWRQQGSVYCGSQAVEIRADEAPITADEASKLESAVFCRRLQQHKHTAPDNFCVGRNIGFDVRKMTLGNKMGLGGGALQGRCSKTGEWNHGNFQLDLGAIMGSFQSNNAMQCKEAVTTPTLFVSRDGFLNVFHSMSDFLNAFQALQILRLDPKDVQVVIFDGDKDGPYFELWNAFGGKGVLSGRAFLDKYRSLDGLVCFTNTIWAIPAGSAFMWKDIWAPNECRMSDLMRAYTLTVLRHFDLLEYTPASDKVARVTLSSRKPFKEKAGQLGRTILNEDRLMAILDSCSEVQAKKVDFAALSYREQLSTIRNTDIYVFMHGAGGTHLVFLPDEAVVVELFPATWHQSSMRNLAKWTGKIYLGWQNTHMDKHGGPSLATEVHEGEFKDIMNQAMHIWSAFHQGKGLYKNYFP